MEDSTGLRLVAENLCLAASTGDKDKMQAKLKLILDNVNLVANPGELLAIMGPSGSGKTSLLNIIAGRTRNFLHDVDDNWRDKTDHIESVSGSPIPSEIGRSKSIKKAPIPYGSIYLNGHKINYQDLKKLSRYVMQSDCLLPFLSVEETIRFTAQLKLSHMAAAERNQIVEDVITNLGLSSCRNVAIGNQIKKGISGGQRKRVSIAIELLEDPQVLFLDEPTSGLDSSLAFDVLKVVKELVKRSKRPDSRGRVRPKTVICTIHQPRKQIYDMFDRLALLSGGKIVFQGPADQIQEYWASVGYPLPVRQNVADWSLDLLTIGHDAKEEKTLSSRGSSFRYLVGRATSAAPVDPLTTSQSFIANGETALSVSKRSIVEADAAVLGAGDPNGITEGQMLRRIIITEDALKELPGKFDVSQWGTDLREELSAAKEITRELVSLQSQQGSAGLIRSFRNTLTLTHRFLVNRWRDKPAIAVSIMVSFLMSLFIGLVYVRLDMPKSPEDCVNYFNVIGIAAFTGTNQSFSAIQRWIDFPLHRPMINREKAGGLYNSASALIGMVLGDLPFLCIPSIVHILTMYWIVGLGNTAAHFFAYWLYALLVCWAATGWVMFATMVAPSSSAASAIAPIGVILSVLLCGLWLTEDALPAFWKGMKYVSWIRYCLNAFLQIRFGGTGIIESCAPIPQTPGPAGNFGIAFAVGIILRIIAGFALAFTNTRQGLEA